METAAFVEATRREGEATLAAGRAGLDAPVPTCEGWVVADVLGHLGRVHRSVAEIIERRAQEVPPVEIPRPPAGDALLDFFAEGLDRVVAALASIGPDEPVYSWSGEGNGRFYHRRMAHELAVHRFDAEAAHGLPGPFDPVMAVDGIDEFYDVLVPFSARRWERALPDGGLALVRTDGPERWWIEGVDGAVVTTRTGDPALGPAGNGPATVAAVTTAAAAVTVSGPASDLFRFVWHRGTGDGLGVVGDVTVAEAWAALAP